MTAVFSHGRLRLYLLTLLDAGPKHGYELIRQLESRFHGRYAPSAGTIYPRLQRLEVERLVTHTAAGGRKVYEITEAGRAELHRRAGEVRSLEADIAAFLDEPPGGVRTAVPRSVDELEHRPAPARPAVPGGREPSRSGPPRGPAPAAALERRLAAFAAQVRTLAHGGRLTDRRLHAANEVLDGALVELRRLLCD